MIFHELIFFARIGGAIGLLLAGGSLIHAQQMSPGPSAANSSSSKAQDVAGLIIETPARLQQGEDATIGQLEHCLFYHVETDGLLIGVTSAEAPEGVPLSLASAAENNATFLSRKRGVKSPKYTIDDVTVSGVPAKKISFSGLIGDQEVYARALCFIKRQQIWVVQILYRDAKKSSAVEAILSSVRIK